MDKKSNGKNISALPLRTNIVKRRLQRADPEMWRRIILCVVIAFTGLAVIGGVVVEYVMHQAAEDYRHMPVTNVIENAQLDSGAYYIYQLYLDTDLRYHFLVSDTRGGVVVSAMPSDDVVIPDDILQAEKYDTACYLLVVDENKIWRFAKTNVYQTFLEKEKKKQQIDSQQGENP